MVTRNDLRAVRDLIAEAKLSVDASLPSRYVGRAPDLLDSALRLMDDLISRPSVAGPKPDGKVRLKWRNVRT
jgi:hypothetical protein